MLGYYVLFALTAAVIARKMRYYKIDQMEPKTNRGDVFLAKHFFAFKEDCGVFCNNNVLCKWFSYNDATWECILFDEELCERTVSERLQGAELFGTPLHQINYTMEDLEVDVCPNGYTQVGAGNRSTCLKFFTTRADNVRAIQTCKRDGGHLVTLADEYLYNETQKLAGDNFEFYVDGSAFANEQSFYTWDCKDLPWTNWDEYEPNGIPASQCHRIYKGKTRSTPCSWKKSFVCQVELKF